ncbi:MAG: carbohydrate kinase family protein [Pseudolysinimonas sp.]
MIAAARVLVVGDANPDLLLRGDVVPRFGQAEQLLDAADLVLGGSAAIMACGLARLGVSTALAAVVGDDVFGRQVLDELAAAGVSLEAMQTRPGEATGLSVHLAVPGDRAILTLPGTIPALDAVTVRAAVEIVHPTHVHVASPFLIPALASTLPDLLAQWRLAGIKSSLDPNWDPSERWDAIAAALPDLDLLFPNGEELAAIAAAAAPGAADAAMALAGLGPRVVVKDGAEGGWSLDAAGARHTARGLQVDVVDTTGAGDSFDAGYLAALIHGVIDEDQRLRWATVAGSLSTRGPGGTSAQPSLDELRAAL